MRYLSLIFVGIFIFTGCGRHPGPKKGGANGGGPPAQENSLQPALEMIRTAQTTVGIREGLLKVESFLAQPEVRPSAALRPADREILSKCFHFNGSEIEAVGSTAFWPFDARHVEECFMLHDAARMIDRRGAAPLDQARHAFAWAMRQVLLREDDGDIVPPAFILERGLGNAAERAIVFLAMLRQFRIPGCVIAWESAPGKYPVVLAGALIEDGKKNALYLFDPRLGLPVPAAQGKGMATFADLVRDPKLVDLGDQKLAGPKVLLVCPQSALTPRMKFLEKALAGKEGLALAVEPEKLYRQVAAAAGVDAQAWDAAVRALPAFLPPGDEGGFDQSVKMERFQFALIPWIAVQDQMARMKLFTELPVQARTTLLPLAGKLCERFGLEARRSMLRGQLDQTIQRLDVIRSSLDDLEFAPLPPEELQKNLAEWRNRVNQVYLALNRQVPGAQSMATKLWSEDQYLMVLMAAKEKPNSKNDMKTILSTIVLMAVKEPLIEENQFLLATCWREKAERTMAHARGGQSPQARENAQEAWFNTADLWRKYAERSSLNPATARVRLGLVVDFWNRKNYNAVVGLWDRALGEWHRAAAARLFLAEAQFQLGQNKDAHATLAALDRDLSHFLTNNDLAREWKMWRSRASSLPTPMHRQSLEALLNDLEPQGGFAWLQKTARALSRRAAE
jgi:hypothetical protein